MIPANVVLRNNWLVMRCWSTHLQCSVLSERDPDATPQRAWRSRWDSTCSCSGENAPFCNQHKASCSRTDYPPLQEGKELEKMSQTILIIEEQFQLFQQFWHFQQLVVRVQRLQHTQDKAEI